MAMFRVLLNWAALFVQSQSNTTRFLLTPSGTAESKGIFLKTFISGWKDNFWICSVFLKKIQKHL